ncbi:MAG: lipid IV(A) 3-deoxy-D-manno-octulosonic acid transferase [Gammaproteobacteria bacterium]
MARLLYSLVLYLSLPWILLRLVRRGRRNPDYRERWWERFGLITPVRGAPIWVHAVSVGETQAVLPLVRRLADLHPDTPILLTTTTPTGAAHVLRVMPPDVEHRYAPYDLPHAVEGFLGRARPRLAIIVETELWPNLFGACARRAIPVVVVNARLSERSARGYRAPHLRAVVRAMMADVSAIGAQTEADARRLGEIGAPGAVVSVTGSMKFDLPIPASAAEQGQVLRRQWGVERPVWIAASTHDGEDGTVLDAHARVRELIPGALLILVPRHPERFDDVHALCVERGFTTVRRAQSQLCAPDCAVYLGDTMGELPVMVAAADLCFMGGSLVPTGGHNVLEPAALGIPVISGRHVFNFQDIFDRLDEAGAVAYVDDAGQLAGTVVELMQAPSRRDEQGQRALRFVEDNRGAVERTLALVDPLLDRANARRPSEPSA